MAHETKAVVDIGTNSMRLLIVSGGAEIGRWVKVTGLGRGVDASGSLSEDAIERTIEVLSGFGRLVVEHGVTSARAVATSASRDAANREQFFDKAEQVLGFRPELTPGAEEAALSYLGATSEATGPKPYVVVDIGGGSTEFVYEHDGEVQGVSIDIGSVRLTDRMLAGRPVPFDDLETAGRAVGDLISGVVVPSSVGTVIGVAGTWTSLAAIAMELPAYDRTKVHGRVLTRIEVEHLIGMLASQSLAETAAIPALDPARAPVILAGALIARETMRHLAALEVTVSEHDLLDGVMSRL